MSKNFERIKRYYDNRKWTLEMLRAVVGKEYGITTEEFKEISGEEYK